MIMTWLNKRKLGLLLAITILFNYSNVQAENIADNTSPVLTWKVWKKNNQIEVSYRSSLIKNDDNIPLLEIKATLNVDSSLSAFLLFLQDVENTPKWLVNAKKSEITHQISVQENQFYVEFKGFWPIKERLLFIQSRYWQNKDLSVNIAIEDARDNIIYQYYPKENNDIIKVNIHQAHWKLTPRLRINTSMKTVNQLQIEYQFIADVGGNIPQWLVRHFSLKSIWKSMRNINRQLPQSSWQQHHIPHIIELSNKIK